MNWNIIPPAGISSSIGLNSEQHPEGTKIERQFGDSPLLHLLS